jgi:hypothetical protein
MQPGPKRSSTHAISCLVAYVAPTFSVVVLAACEPNFRSEGAGIQSVLDDDRRAHLQTDAELLAAHLADSVFNIDGGQVIVQTKKEIEAFFRAYFDGAIYHAWEDVTPPVISVSEDGSMAWVARTVYVDREEPGPGDEPWRREFTSAYTATYENTEAGWKMTSVTSTFLPGLSDGQRLLSAMRSALGGEAVVAATRSLVASARVEGPSADYDVVTRSTRDGRVRLEFSTGFLAGIDREDAWGFDDATGASQPLDAATRTFVRGHELHMTLLAPETRYGEPRYTGVGSFEGAPALRLTFLDELGSPVDIYLALADTLPLGMTLVNHTGRGARDVAVAFDDWQPLGDLMLFRSATFLHGDDVYRYVYYSLDANAPLSDSIFRPPE